MLTVACYLWGWEYSTKDVYLLKRMVDRHLTVPHEFVCLTDEPHRFDTDEIRVVELPEPPSGKMFCWQKLTTFHPDAERMIGKRILALDLDAVIVGEMDSLVNRPEPLVLWRNPSRRPWNAWSPRALYNSSMVLIKAGACPEVWERRHEGTLFPGDQDWVSWMVGPKCAYWDDSHGVYRLGREDTPGSGVDGVLPDNARVVFFPGSEGKPTLPAVVNRCPWIAEHRV